MTSIENEPNNLRWVLQLLKLQQQLVRPRQVTVGEDPEEEEYEDSSPFVQTLSRAESILEASRL